MYYSTYLNNTPLYARFLLYDPGYSVENIHFDPVIPGVAGPAGSVGLDGAQGRIGDTGEAGTGYTGYAGDTGHYGYGTFTLIPSATNGSNVLSILNSSTIQKYSLINGWNTNAYTLEKYLHFKLSFSVDSFSPKVYGGVSLTPWISANPSLLDYSFFIDTDATIHIYQADEEQRGVRYPDERAETAVAQAGPAAALYYTHTHMFMYINIYEYIYIYIPCIYIKLTCSV